MKTIFIEARSNQDVSKLIPKLLKQLKQYKKIGLTATVQHLDELKELYNYLKLNGKEITLAKGPRCKYKGQVLGCDATVNRADAYVFVGTGKFHPLAIAAETNKPVFIANPFTNKVERIKEAEVRRYRNRRAINASKVKSAKVVGILATVKPGQNQLELAIKLQKKLEKAGKTAFVFLGETINLAGLKNFSKVEAWVNTCCPRIADDVEQVGRPIANWFDI